MQDRKCSWVCACGCLWSGCACMMKGLCMRVDARACTSCEHVMHVQERACEHVGFAQWPDVHKPQPSAYFDSRSANLHRVFGKCQKPHDSPLPSYRKFMSLKEEVLFKLPWRCDFAYPNFFLDGRYSSYFPGDVSLPPQTSFWVFGP